MVDGEKQVELGVVIESLMNSMEVISNIAENRKLSADDLVKCELMASQFKKDFDKELLRS